MSSAPMEISTVSPTTATCTWRRRYLVPARWLVPAKQTLPLLSTLRVTEAASTSGLLRIYRR
jgi:hypothetical protein